MKTGRVLGASIAILGFLAACSGSSDDGSVNGNNALSQHQVTGSSLPKMTIALTFDDGPGPRTSELSTYLKGEGIQAGFFMEGVNAKGKDTLLQQVNADGHVIGNHTWDHPLLTKLSTANIQTQLQNTDNVLSPFFQGKMKMFRAPYGGWSPTIADNMNKTALVDYVGSIFWDIGGDLTATHAADWACWGNAHISIPDCGNRYIQEIHDRGDHGLVLMHDIHSNTIDMVKYMVPKLKAAGYKFARVDQIPAINAQLVEKGATPLAAIGGGTTSSGFKLAPGTLKGLDDDPILSQSCPRDGVFCGSTLGGDPSTLYRCTSQQLVHVCVCTSDCAQGDDQVDGACDCDVSQSEPGVSAGTYDDDDGTTGDAGTDDASDDGNDAGTDDASDDADAADPNQP